MIKKYGAHIIALSVVWIVIFSVVQGVRSLDAYIKTERYEKQQLAQAISSIQASIALTQEDLSALKTELGVSQSSLEETKLVNSRLSIAVDDERKMRLQSETTLKKQVQEVAKRGDVATVVKQWRPRIAQVKCTWVQGQKTTGSGLLIGKIDGTYKIQTNHHVVNDESLGSPESCTVRLPGDELVSANNLKSHASLDIATLSINTPSSIMATLSSSITPKVCTKRADTGNPIIVLGYPSIGSKGDVTATEGIISGYDGNYYITSAKIEQGNSGGAAISLQDNCLLGVPTLTYVGKIESLGRILDWQSIQK